MQQKCIQSKDCFYLRDSIAKDGENKLIQRSACCEDSNIVEERPHLYPASKKVLP